jgi:beta-aspartyl-peptidase (threonine type)
MTACLWNRPLTAFLFAALFASSGFVCYAVPAVALDSDKHELASPDQAEPGQHWAIAIHGGAGESEWEHMDAATAAAYHDSLAKALAAGSAVLKKHGKALDAVSAAVMEHTPYVMMVGPGADAFSKAQGLEQQPPSFFFTEMRWQEFAAIMKASGRPVPPRPAGVAPEGKAELSLPAFAHRFGTVGAVARDSEGHLAAATSTGGMQGKLPGRVGDSPLIGAGTYASDKSCAVSGTGVGEYFIRLTLAREICTLVQEGKSPQEAADQMIHTELPALKGGEGGVIVMAPSGEPIWSSNTLGMFRAREVEGSEPEVYVK